MKRNLNIFLLLFLLLLCLPATIAAAFSDVKSSDWFAADVGDMTAEGLICGYPDGTFRPGRTITAAEFVSIVGARAATSPARLRSRKRPMPPWTPPSKTTCMSSSTGTSCPTATPSLI